MEVRIYIRSYTGKGFCFLISHVFPFLCSYFCQSSAYLVIINIFYHKFIEVFMQRFVKGIWASVLFWTRFHTVILPTPKKLNVTLHPVMTCKGTIILDISFELKLFLLCLIESLSLIIDGAFVHNFLILFHSLVWPTFVYAYSLILKDDNYHYSFSCYYIQTKILHFFSLFPHFWKAF